MNKPETTEGAVKKIALNNPVKNKKGEDITELVLDFSKISGKTMTDAERTCRQMGDTAPQIVLSMQYQAIIAAKAAGVGTPVIEDLPGNKFTECILMVQNFLASGVSA